MIILLSYASLYIIILKLYAVTESKVEDESLEQKLCCQFECD